ncbi:MAG: hypothetical protein ACK4EY_07500 [Flavipsychrobacter sp.]
MRHTILFITFLLLVSFTASYEPRNSTAEVEQVQGCYIFIDSRPVKEYKYLGTVKSTFSWGSGQYQDVRDKLIKRIKKEYPEADGIIFHFHDGGQDRADAIRFN